jgi:hypothetical protein
VVVAAVLVVWWAAVVGLGQPAGGPAALEFLFLFYENFLCREQYSPRHTCNESIWRGSRQRGLCRPSGAESALPSVPSRHRLCREELGLCREHRALGKAIESGSDGRITMELWEAIAALLHLLRVPQKVKWKRIFITSTYYGYKRMIFWHEHDLCMCQQFDREAYNALMDYETQIDPIAKMATIKFLSTLMSIIQPIIRRH